MLVTTRYQDRSMDVLSDLPIDLLHEVFSFFDLEEVVTKSAVCKRIYSQVYDSNTFWFRYCSLVQSVPTIGESSQHIGPQTMDCFFASADSIKSAKKKGLLGEFVLGSLPSDFASKATRLEQLACLPLQSLCAMLGAIYKGHVGCPGQALCQRTFDLAMMRKVFEHFAPHVHWPLLRVFSREAIRAYVQQHGIVRNRNQKVLDDSSFTGLRCFHKKHYTGLVPDGRHATYREEVDYRSIVLHKEKRTRLRIVYPARLESNLDAATRSFEQAFRALVVKGTRLLNMKRDQARAYEKYDDGSEGASAKQQVGRSLMPAFDDARVRDFLLDHCGTPEQRALIAKQLAGKK